MFDWLKFLLLREMLVAGCLLSRSIQTNESYEFATNRPIIWLKTNKLSNSEMVGAVIAEVEVGPSLPTMM